MAPEVVRGGSSGHDIVSHVIETCFTPADPEVDNGGFLQDDLVNSENIGLQIFLNLERRGLTRNTPLLLSLPPGSASACLYFYRILFPDTCHSISSAPFQFLVFF